MDLILWRHCEAEPGEPDLGRRLTSKGIKQAERMAAWLDAHLPDTCRILVSPADRAQQTALALQAQVQDGAGTGARRVGGGACSPRPTGPTRASPCSIVGHQPTLGAVASFLLSGEEAYWSVRKGAVWWLSNRAKEGGAAVVLKVVLGPDFV